MRTTRWWVIVLLVATYTAPWPGATGSEPVPLMQGSLSGEASEVHADRSSERALPAWAAAQRHR